jgi:excisionase family DNA binding protein
MSEDRLHSVESAADFCGGLSKYTIAAWLSQGKLRRTKVGSRTMIRQSELERFIAEGDGGKSTGRQRAEQQGEPLFLRGTARQGLIQDGCQITGKASFRGKP